MLTDAQLRKLKPADKMYKVADRDGLYAAVLPTGKISWRWNYRINGRQETLTLGRYGVLGLAEARQALVDAKKRLAAGSSPARVKARERAKAGAEQSFGAWAKEYFAKHPMAESTRDMRLSVYRRDLERQFGSLQLHEITGDDLRALCDAIVARGAPATAVQVREIVQWIFTYAAERGRRHPNPAAEVKPSTIATFRPRERALAPEEIGLLYRYLERISTGPVYRLATKLLLLTMVRKGELAGATWGEVNFTEAVWAIPGPRMKRRNPHNVYLSRQALDLLVALKTCAGGSSYVLPGRYDGDRPMSAATLNRVTTAAIELAQKEGAPLGPFVLHDFRRTASTILHEAGYNTDHIEKCLAHEQKGVRAVYNKAEYAEQRRAMLQDWADMIERWTATAPAD
jgi:integrase